MRDWQELVKKPGPDTPTSMQLLAYTKGYILALEDILKDIDQWYMDTGDDMDYHQGLDAVRYSVSESWREANRTLEHLL